MLYAKLVADWSVRPRCYNTEVFFAESHLDIAIVEPRKGVGAYAETLEIRMELLSNRRLTVGLYFGNLLLPNCAQLDLRRTFDAKGREVHDAEGFMDGGRVNNKGSRSECESSGGQEVLER